MLTAAAPTTALSGRQVHVWRDGALGIGIEQRHGAVHVAVVLDDRAESLTSDHAVAWRRWLGIANALQLRDWPTVVTTVTRVLAEVAAPVSAVTRRSDTAPSLPAEWVDVHEQATSVEERELFTELAHHGGIPVPTLGFEGPDGIPLDISWPDGEDRGRHADGHRRGQAGSQERRLDGPESCGRRHRRGARGAGAGHVGRARGYTGAVPVRETRQRGESRLMPTIIMSKMASKLDGSLKSKVMSFLQKLSEDDTTQGLHIEPIENAVDKRVRTGRVDQGNRAVMFRLDDGGERYYVVHGVWAHDDANARAMKVRLTVNPVNGLPQFEEVEGGSVSTAATVTAPQRSWSTVEVDAVPMLVQFGVQARSADGTARPAGGRGRPRAGRIRRGRTGGAGVRVRQQLDRDGTHRPGRRRCAGVDRREAQPG